MKITAKLWIGIAVLIVLSPLGLILPWYFKSTGAWVEVRPQCAQGKSSAPYWGQANIYPAAARTLEAKSSGGWKAPFADYGFKGWEEKDLVHSSAAYIVSAIAGIGLIIIAVWLIGKMLAKKKD